ncbi:hypothetical protein Vadar_006987 [Vaccinium darrowii]|uniref:Uncharacterized protein n=1 Tax=Vaccinium darrowii TaxID=229202 RepID=A0ACB7X830_9ERIC|nr:hypothetical protein Vadar_006987 [Vaccinium darrowii]
MEHRFLVLGHVYQQGPGQRRQQLQHWDQLPCQVISRINLHRFLFLKMALRSKTTYQSLFRSLQMVLPISNVTKGDQKDQATSSVSLALETASKLRPLKLVYDHDVRLARMPVNCNFRELKLAESSVDSVIVEDTETDKVDSVGMLRLHIVDVGLEQEPPILEEEEKSLATEEIKVDECGSHSSLGGSAVESVDTETDKPEKDAPKEKSGALEDPDFKEVEMDDWLVEFAQLFRSHVGIDSDAHIDLHELGMELCSEPLKIQ